MSGPTPAFSSSVIDDTLSSSAVSSISTNSLDPSKAELSSTTTTTDTASGSSPTLPTPPESTLSQTTSEEDATSSPTTLLSTLILITLSPQATVTPSQLTTISSFLTAPPPSTSSISSTTVITSSIATTSTTNINVTSTPSTSSTSSTSSTTSTPTPITQPTSFTLLSPVYLSVLPVFILTLIAIIWFIMIPNPRRPWSCRSHRKEALQEIPLRQRGPGDAYEIEPRMWRGGGRFVGERSVGSRFQGGGGDTGGLLRGATEMGRQRDGPSVWREQEQDREYGMVKEVPPVYTRYR